MKATVPLQHPFLVVLLLLGSAAVFAQSQDWHLSNDGARAFFIRSTFAHGYMHGYEEGFHQGDLDLQMGRKFRDIKSQEKFKKPCGYENDFGDHGSYDSGYRKGYFVGYIDAYGGRAFRAIQLVTEARSETFPPGEAVPDVAFDRAFMTGYEAGQQFGLRDGRADTKAAAIAPNLCGGTPEHSPQHTPQFCAAYRCGYELGYSDGYSNQQGFLFARK